jgi:hypothetical protein
MMASTMGRTTLSAVAKILAFSAAVEICTGRALEAKPTIVVSLLLGVDDSSEGLTAVGRLFGIALIALGLACCGRLDGRDAYLCFGSGRRGHS